MAVSHADAVLVAAHVYAECEGATGGHPAHAEVRLESTEKIIQAYLKVRSPDWQMKPRLATRGMEDAVANAIIDPETGRLRNMLMQPLQYSDAWTIQYDAAPDADAQSNTNRASTTHKSGYKHDGQSE